MKTVRLNQKLNFYFFLLLLTVMLITVGTVAFGQIHPSYQFESTKTSFTLSMEDMDEIDSVILEYSNPKYDTAFVMNPEDGGLDYEYTDDGTPDDIEWMKCYLLVRGSKTEEGYLIVIRRKKNKFEFDDAIAKR